MPGLPASVARVQREARGRAVLWLLRRNGGESRMSPAHRIPLRDRIADKIRVNLDTRCWLWTGCTRGRGYGAIDVDGSLQPAHRVVYELLVGPIPEGYQVDHLCREPACVNPDHLEAVTAAENNRRSSSPSAENARKTHCLNGHELTPENSYRPPGKEARYCRTCQARRSREHRERKAAA